MSIVTFGGAGPVVIAVHWVGVELVSVPMITISRLPAHGA